MSKVHINRTINMGNQCQIWENNDNSDKFQGNVYAKCKN